MRCGGGRRCTNARIRGGRPGARRVEIATLVVTPAIFGCAKIVFGVCCHHSREPRLRPLDAQPLEHRQHRRGRESVAVAPCSKRAWLRGGNAVASAVSTQRSRHGGSRRSWGTSHRRSCVCKGPGSVEVNQRPAPARQIGLSQHHTGKLSWHMRRGLAPRPWVACAPTVSASGPALAARG